MNEKELKSAIATIITESIEDLTKNGVFPVNSPKEKQKEFFDNHCKQMYELIKNNKAMYEFFRKVNKNVGLEKLRQIRKLAPVPTQQVVDESKGQTIGDITVQIKNPKTGLPILEAIIKGNGKEDLPLQQKLLVDLAPLNLKAQKGTTAEELFEDLMKLPYDFSEIKKH